MTKHGEVSKVNHVIGSSIYKYVVYWSIKRKNTNDLPTISTVLTWWLSDVLTTCIRRTVKLAARPITPPLIICYIDISVSPDLKEIFIIAGHVYVWNEALLKILKVGIVSLIKYFGTKKDYCCQRYKRPQNSRINTKRVFFFGKEEFFVSHIFLKSWCILFLKWITWVDIRRCIFVINFNWKLDWGEMGNLKFDRQFLK